MKHLFTRALALVCIVLLIASLAACGEKTEDTAATTAQTAAADSSAAATEAAAPATEAATEAAASNAGIVGTWEYEYGGFTYTFKDDGTGTYDIFGDEMNFTYTITDTEVSIQFEGEDASSHLEYTLNGDVLNIKDSAGNDTIYNRK